jgi:hypothetical protein
LSPSIKLLKAANEPITVLFAPDVIALPAAAPNKVFCEPDVTATPASLPKAEL